MQQSVYAVRLGKPNDKEISATAILRYRAPDSFTLSFWDIAKDECPVSKRNAHTATFLMKGKAWKKAGNISQSIDGILIYSGREYTARLTATIGQKSRVTLAF